MAERYPLMKSLIKMPLFRFPSFWDEMEQELAEVSGFEQTGLTVYEDKNNVIVEAAVPGMKKEEIDISVDKGILWIKAEKKEEEKSEERKYYRMASSSFSYRIALPGQIDESKEPVATYKDGVMKVTFPKAAKSQSKKINVQ